MVTRGGLTEGGRWVVAGALLLCAMVHFPVIVYCKFHAHISKQEEMFCKMTI